MKKALTFFITVFMLAVLCTGCSGPNEQTNEYKIEENTADNKATYPYVVHTDSAIWYLSQDDIDLLGEDVFFEGLSDILQYQDSDFSDARAALSGFIQDKVEPIEIRTDFCGKAGISKTEIVGAYYNSRSNFIKVFRDWNATKDSLLHEYVHYLTIHCTQTPAKHGLFTEGIADYISMMVCHNRMRRDSSRSRSEAEISYFKMHGAWDEEEDCIDPRLFEIGMAECYSQGIANGTEYLSTEGKSITRTAEIQQNPTAETISYGEAACILAYLIDTYSKETVLANLNMDPIDMEKVYGESFADIYKHWKKCNTEYFSKAGLTLLD